jgi:hypothetical protein
MPNKADNPGDRWGSLEDFIDQFPDHLFAIKEPELLYKGPEGYAPLVTTKQGSWRAINSRGLPVALAWTDWEDGFDVHILLDGHVSRRMRNYTFSAKACGITASWAYTTLDKYIESFDPDDSVTLGPQQQGPLSAAQNRQFDRPVATRRTIGTERQQMAPKADDDADIAKVPGARILVSRNKDTNGFVGLYAFVSSKGVFIRAYRTWLKATGHALQQFNNTKVTHMTHEFIDVFDDRDQAGSIPSDAEITTFVDHSYDLPKQPTK